MKDRLLFVDTETGGIDPNKHSLLSLAMLVWEDSKIIDTLEILVNDGQLIVTEEALLINKIDIDKHKELAIPSSKAVEKILFFFHKHFPNQNNITLAGHNVHFDANFLKVFFLKNGQSYHSFFSHRIIDTSSILYYLYLTGYIKQKAISSDEAFAFFDIKVKGRHTALGDVIATAMLFNKLMHLLNQHSNINIDLC